MKGSGRLRVINSLFLRNTAQNGGGVFAQKCANPFSLVLTPLSCISFCPPLACWLLWLQSHELSHECLLAGQIS